jgi:hypothetical protein
MYMKQEQNMKISIDTIPLWDAFRQTDLCPFCAIQNKLEELYVDMYLGDSVMEPDIRVKVNKVGFCEEHFMLLYMQKTSKLGLALMVHTHLLETINTVNSQIEALDHCCEEGSSLFKRAAATKDWNSLISDTADHTEKKAHTCVICERMDTHMERYHETAQHMWSHDADFRKLFDQSSGFCIPHWAAQLKASRSMVATKATMEFVKSLNTIQKKALNQMASDLEWFTKKFDYRNTDKPWGTSKDALPRALNMLKGYIVSKDS